MKYDSFAKFVVLMCFKFKRVVQETQNVYFLCSMYCNQSLSPINLWELIELCKQRQINLTDKVKQVVSSIQ